MASEFGPGAVTLETPLGHVKVTATDGECVYVDGSGNGAYLTVRGARIAASFALWRDDGAPHGWTATNPRGGESWRTSLYARKLDAPTYAQSEPSQSAKDKILSSVIPVVAAYLAAHPDVLERAQQAHVGNEIRWRENEICRLQERIATRQAEIAALVG